MDTENEEAAPNNPEQFKWEALAFQATTPSMAGDDLVRKARISVVMEMMRRVCIEHGLASLLDRYTVHRNQTPEEDAELREAITGKVLVFAYLFPGAARTIRSLQIAHELGVRTFVVCEQNEAFTDDLEPTLRKVTCWGGIDDSNATLEIMAADLLNENLVYLRNRARP